MLSRRNLIIQLPAVAVAGSFAARALAADKTITIGINLPLTGADAHDAELIKDGATMAIEEATAKGLVGGYKVEVMILDDGTATAGQYDPAQAATNARKMVSDNSVVAAKATSRSSRHRRPIQTSPTRNSRASTARPARRSISAR